MIYWIYYYFSPVQGQCSAGNCVQKVNATAGDVVRIPCGDTLPDPDITFVYHTNGPTGLATQYLLKNEYLLINVTADDNADTIICTSFVDGTPNGSCCYELNVFCKLTLVIILIVTFPASQIRPR